MSWFSNLWQRPRQSDSASSAFRPRLEPLDDRCLPNVSPVSTAAGLFHFVVDSATSSLTMVTPNGVSLQVIDGTKTPVRVAHGFRDPAGNLGLDYVLASGDAFHYEGGTLSQIGHGNFLDLSTAYGHKDGSIRIDAVVTSEPGPFPLGAADHTIRTGTLLEFNGKSIVTLATGVRWATAFEDANGSTGLATSIVTGGKVFTQTVQVRKYDTVTGVLPLFATTTVLVPPSVGINTPQPDEITDYSQTVSSNGVVITDLTFGNPAGASALEFVSGSGPSYILTLSTPARSTYPAPPASNIQIGG